MTVAAAETATASGGATSISHDANDLVSGSGLGDVPATENARAGLDHGYRGRGLVRVGFGHPDGLCRVKRKLWSFALYNNGVANGRGAMTVTQRKKRR